MSTQQIIDCWQNGVEPYTLRKPKRANTDRFGKPISKHFTTSGFPRLKLWREMQKAKISSA